MKTKANGGKGIVGCGGIKCPCCTKGQPTVTKSLTARHNRRSGKKEIRKILAESVK